MKEKHESMKKTSKKILEQKDLLELCALVIILRVGKAFSVKVGFSDMRCAFVSSIDQ